MSAVNYTCPLEINMGEQQVYFRFCFVVSIVSFWTFSSHVNGKLIGAFVLPHGGIALDPLNFNTTNSTALEQARQLHEACLKVGHDVRELQPDIVVLSTPHGLSDYKNFLFYMNAVGSGYGDVDDCLHLPCRYNLSVQLHPELTTRIVNMFGYTRNVSALSAFGPTGNTNEVPLRWGEVIPLLFVGNLTATRLVILSQPTRRYTDDVIMLEELLRLGEDMYQLLESLTERVAVIISSDLAHTHSHDGPYGYSNTSEPFDQAVQKWAETLDRESLLVTAASLVDRALSCGFTGLVMLEGILSALPFPRQFWQSTVYANLHPSYYGMMAASFLRSGL